MKSALALAFTFVTAVIASPLDIAVREGPVCVAPSYGEYSILSVFYLYVNPI
jgi:hypothetical protein